MSLQELEAQALSRGMPYNEVVKLRERIARLKQEERPGTVEIPGRRVSTEIPCHPGYLTNFSNLLMRYGYSGMIFSEGKIFHLNRALIYPHRQITSWAPEMRLSLRYGAHHSNLTGPVVTPEGQINISNIGPVMVNGMTVEKASDLIKSRLSTIYSGMRTAQSQYLGPGKPG
jgi:protein involved in polysaccharide export with SLBB domain